MTTEHPVTRESQEASPVPDTGEPLPRFGYRHLLRPTISKKFALLMGAVLLVAAANGLVVKSMLEQRHGIAEMINVAGSLRFLSQKTQVDLQRVVLGVGNGSHILLEDMGRFEERIAALEAGGEVEGVSVHRVPDELQPLIKQVHAGWSDYRADIEALLEKHKPLADASADLNHLYFDGAAILTMSNALTGELARRADRAEEAALAKLYAMALVDVLVIAIGFFVIRARVVAPLRRLAEASRRFAAGHYGERVGFRSRDEIGQLAEAFDQMAGETESHIQRIADNVLEMRRAERSLFKLSQAVEQSPVAVLITDSYGTIEYVNPKFVETSGYAREECVGQKARMLKSGKTPIGTYRDMWTTILAGQEWRGDIQNRRKNGEVYWEAMRISPIRNPEGRIAHFVAVKSDITERKRAEEEIRRLNADLELMVEERTRQLQASYKELEAFSYSVSHDLRAPLRAINGFAQLATERCADCPDRETLGYIERINNASQRMGELIDDLLRLSGIGRSELAPERVDLSEMARQVMADLSGAAPGRKLALDIADEVVVQGDPRLLRIALENLLGNAWKFTAKREVAVIGFGLREENGERVIFVRDNGAGFDPRYAKKLFGAFQRLHRADEFEGSGIGLAIVQRIVNRHGGRIWADAELGRGAVFSFVLPEPPPPVSA